MLTSQHTSDEPSFMSFKLNLEAFFFGEEGKRGGKPAAGTNKHKLTLCTDTIIGFAE